MFRSSCAHLWIMYCIPYMGKWAAPLGVLFGVLHGGYFQRDRESGIDLERRGN